MKVCTIGFTQKNAEKFFGLLMKNGVKTVIDVRLNNTSQLAAFTKGEDLRYFLSAIGGIGYVHDVLLAPTEDLLKRYKRGETTWDEYEKEFARIMQERDAVEHIKKTYAGIAAPVCLLCSEPTPEHCHRRLVADLFISAFPASQIIHLV